MHKTKRALIFFVFLLCLTSLAYAQDFALFSGKFYDFKGGEEKIRLEPYNGTYSICENDKKEIPILFANKDSKNNNTYTLESAGASWARLSSNEFSLPKGQSGIVFLSLSPAQGSSGKYDVWISALSSLGSVRKSLKLDINVEKCSSIKLELEKLEDTACGGETKQYAGEIINDGKLESSVELMVNGPSWISADEYVFSVAPGNKKQFELKGDVPPSARGTFEVLVTATIKSTQASLEKSMKIEAVPKYDCYRADIISDEKIRNYYSDDYVPIKIRNSGIKQAGYGLSLEAPGWISVEPNKIVVNPGQSGNFNLHINPNETTPEGDYPIKINIQFEDISYPQDINIILRKGSSFSKELKSFFVFYQYYAYAAIIAAAILFFSARGISSKIKTMRRNHKIKKSRLRVLEAARKARQEKRESKK